MVAAAIRKVAANVAKKPKEDIRVTELRARRDELLQLQMQARHEWTDEEQEELDMLRVELYKMGENNGRSGLWVCADDCAVQAI